MQGKMDEAYDAFFKSGLECGLAGCRLLALAQIDTARGKYESALDKVERSLIRNWHNHKARQLKASILRKLNRKEEALDLIRESLKIDRFNMGCRFDALFIDGGSEFTGRDDWINAPLGTYIY